MRFERINYSYRGETGRNSKQVESYNFHKAASVLAEYGFDCVRIPNDWHGVDFLAYHSETGQTLEVQLKTCLVIDKKYLDYEDLYMCFPIDETGNWYLIKHSRLVEIVCKQTDWLYSDRWMRDGRYFSYKTNRAIKDTLEEFAYVPRHEHLGFREVTYNIRRKLL